MQGSNPVFPCFVWIVYSLLKVGGGSIEVPPIIIVLSISPFKAFIFA